MHCTADSQQYSNDGAADRPGQPVIITSHRKMGASWKTGQTESEESACSRHSGAGMLAIEWPTVVSGCYT